MLQPGFKINNFIEKDLLTVIQGVSMGYAFWPCMACLLLLLSCENDCSRFRARKEQSWLHSKLSLSSMETLSRFRLNGNGMVRLAHAYGRRVSMLLKCPYTVARKPKRSSRGSSLVKKSIWAELIEWTGDAWFATSITKGSIWRTTSLNINDKGKPREERL